MLTVAQIIVSMTPLPQHSTSSVFHSVELCILTYFSAPFFTTLLSVGRETSISVYFSFLPRSVMSGLMQVMVLSFAICCLS